MGTNRLEAFSDGVIAVIITIMVLELKVPADATFASLTATLPSFLVYALSFVVVAIMWVNHHFLLKAAKRSDAQLLWANNLLLFWMSIIPLVTAYLGRYPHAALPVAAYGFVVTLTCCAFLLLQIAVAKHHEEGTREKASFIPVRRKAAFSVALYAFSVVLAFSFSFISLAIFVVIPALYFLPGRTLPSDALN